MKGLKFLKDTAPHIDCGNIQSDIKDVLDNCINDNLKMMRYNSNISRDDLYCLISDIIHDVHVSIPTFYNCYIEYYHTDTYRDDCNDIIYQYLSNFTFPISNIILDDVYVITWNVIHDIIFEVYNRW